MSSKAGWLVQVGMCRADSVSELNHADSRGSACPSLDSLTAWFSDHGNHQEGQSREDGLGGKGWEDVG